MNMYFECDDLLCKELYDGWKEVRDFIEKEMLEDYNYGAYEKVVKMVDRLGRLEDVGYMMRLKGCELEESK